MTREFGEIAFHLPKTSLGAASSKEQGQSVQFRQRQVPPRA
jgi:hypothetical protein